MTEQHRSANCATECGEIRRHVVDGGNESVVHDVGDCYEQTTREGHGLNRPGNPGDSIPWKRGWSHGEQAQHKAVPA